MRSAVIHAHGSLPLVQDRPAPVPKDDEVLVRVEAAALNPVDLFIASGRFYGAAPEPPYVPGVEGVGRIAGTGRMVWFEAFPQGGALAELVAVPADRTVELPPGADPFAVAAVGYAGLAAWLALTRSAALEPGERVLVLGAGGAVGRYAMQLAALLDAGLVAGAARAAAERALGDLVLDLSERGWVDEARSRNLEFDVIVDPLWGDVIASALRLAARCCRVVQIGNAAGTVATLPAAALRSKEAVLMGHTNGSVPFDEKREAITLLAGHLAAGRLNAPHRAVAFNDLAVVWAVEQQGRRFVLAPASHG